MTTPASDAVARAVKVVLEAFPWTNPEFDVETRIEGQGLLWNGEISIIPGKSLGITVVSRGQTRLRIDTEIITVEADDIVLALGFLFRKLKDFDWANDRTKGFQQLQSLEERKFLWKNSDKKTEIFLPKGTRIVMSPTGNAFLLGTEWIRTPSRTFFSSHHIRETCLLLSGWTVAEVYALGKDFKP